MDLGADGGIGGGTAGIGMRGVFVSESGDARILCVGAAGGSGGDYCRSDYSGVCKMIKSMTNDEIRMTNQ